MTPGAPSKCLKTWDEILQSISWCQWSFEVRGRPLQDEDVSQAAPPAPPMVHLIAAASMESSFGELFQIALKVSYAPPLPQELGTHSRSRLVFVTLEENKIMEQVSLKKLSLIRNCVRGHERFDSTFDFSGKCMAGIDKAVCGEGTWRGECSVLHRFLKSVRSGSEQKSITNISYV